MNENQPNFESLRRLLALKRHETPPPGYFNNFSSQVMARIRAGETETADGWSGRLFASMPWLLSALQAVETRPVFAGGFATALCALLLFGAVIAQRPDSASMAIPATSHNGSHLLCFSHTCRPDNLGAASQPVHGRR